MKKVKFLFIALVAPCLFGCGEDEKKEDYTYLGQIAPYLHEVKYEDYEFDKDRLTVSEYLPSCSVVRNGNFVGRNFDFYFDDIPEFIVHVKGNKDRYSSVGVARTPLFNETDLVAGNVNKDYFKLLPNVMMDGINEKGVVICTNVVANEGVVNHGTNLGKEDLGIWFVGREVLNHAASAKEGVDIILNRNIVGDFLNIENFHFMIADSISTYIVEIIGNEVVAKEKTGDNQIMTNFLCNIDGINDHPSGLERYQILKDNYSMGSTFKGMQDLLYKARFSQSFNPNMDPLWVSDAGIYTYQQISSGEAATSYKEMLEGGMYEEFTHDFENNIRSSDPSLAWWITVSNSTYDIQNRIFKIYVQENYKQCYEFKI